MLMTHSVRVRAALVVIVAVAATLLTPLVVAQTPSTAPAATSATAPTAAGAGAPDGGWPRTYSTKSGAALIVYQPQVSTWENQKHVVLYAAMSYTP